jgi:hypothetical protein
MKRTILLFAVILHSGLGGFSQITFIKTYGGLNNDGGYSIVQTSDSGYIIAGQTDMSSNLRADFYIIKTNSLGNVLWTKTYGTVFEEYAYSLELTNDGGFIVSGYEFYNSDWSDYILLVKFNSMGDTIWSKRYGRDSWEQGGYVKQTHDGGYIITGSSVSSGDGLCEVWLIKTNAFGDTTWTKTFGGYSANYGLSVIQTNDYGYVITGSSHKNMQPNTDVYLIKTDSIGDTLWTKFIGGPESEEGQCIAQTSDGGFIITGSIYYYGTMKTDVYLVRTDSNGDTIWTKTYGNTDYDYGYSVIQNSDGGFTIAGRTNLPGLNNTDVYLIRTDQNGVPIWERTFGGWLSEEGRSVIQTLDNGFAIIGSTITFGNGGCDVYFIKTDEIGHATNVEENTSSSNNISISPNPFTQSTQITLPQTYRSITLEVYNLQGQQVAQYQYADCDKIQLRRNQLKSGLYFLKLTGDDGVVRTGKVVVE